MTDSPRIPSVFYVRLLVAKLPIYVLPGLSNRVLDIQLA